MTPDRLAHPRVTVVGATGAVGRTFLALMRDRGFPARDVELVASARSAGGTVRVGADPLPVHDLAEYDFTGRDMAFFSAGTEVSATHAPRAVAAGCLVIDNSNAFRMRPDAHLVVPQVNGGVLERLPASGIVANPNCSTIPLVRLLQPLHEHHGLTRVTVSTYQAASGRGRAGTRELLEGARHALRDPDAEAVADVFDPPLAFNVVPLIDELLDDGGTLEERKMRQEARRILALPDLDLTATCVRVPVVDGHAESVVVDCARTVPADEVAKLLAAAPEVRVWSDGPPTPRCNPRPDLVHVGRIRTDPEHGRRILFWLVADNLRIGAALNALQIAESVARRAVRRG
ncbi:aspartate-semialdehyde dehydrogenase [Streptomyces sp. NPDC088785]|uniref:aspartate-semialdehyde dehydrogenase n=1 Tax=Streptomyces sp. NPDC088785 TaxID=3365897 RepID=UPI0038273129